MMAVPAIESAGGVAWKMINSNMTAKTTYIMGDDQNPRPST